MRTYQFEKTSTRNVWRVVNTKTRNWEWYWSGRLGRDKIPAEEGIWLRAESSIINNGWPKGKWFLDWLRTLPKEESDRIFEEASRRGTRVHRAIEMMFESNPKTNTFSGLYVTKKKTSVIRREMEVWDEKQQKMVPLEHKDWECILSFAHFWNLHAPFVFAVGSTLVNERMRYAGTTDITGWILTKSCGVKQCPCGPVIGKIGLVDLKTTTAIRDAHGLQVAAFAAADNIREYLNGRDVQYTCDLRLGTDHVNTRGYEFVVYDTEKTAKNLESFLHANAIDEATRTEFSPEKEIQTLIYDVAIEIRPVPKTRVLIVNGTTKVKLGKKKTKLGK